MRSQPLRLPATDSGSNQLHHGEAYSPSLGTVGMNPASCSASLGWQPWRSLQLQGLKKKRGPWPGQVDWQPVSCSASPGGQAEGSDSRG